MKRILKMSVLIGIAIALVFPTMAIGCPPPPPPCEAKLWAGQDTLSAIVTLSQDGTNLYISFDMKDGWKIKQLHVAIEVDPADIPQTKKHSLKPGKFQFKENYSPAMGDFTYIIPKADIHGTGNMYVIVHAVVVKCDASETAWVNKCDQMDYFKDLFGDSSGGGWATYLRYRIW
jgi:hypothetical protein